MCPHLFIDPVVDSGFELSDILLRVDRRKAVGVLERLLRIVVIDEAEAVIRKLFPEALLLRQKHCEKARLVRPLHRPGLPGEHYGNLLCGREEGLDQESLREKPRAQDPLWVRAFKIADLFHIRPVHKLI